MLRPMALMATVVAMTGCAGGAATSVSSESDAPPIAASPPPSDYRQKVVARVRRTFFDPYTIRDASISQPLSASGVFDGVTFVPHSGWMVCVRANAKNRMGAYIGLKETPVLFKEDAVADLDLSPHHCAKAVYEPFPEIEEGYRAPVAAARPRR